MVKQKQSTEDRSIFDGTPSGAPASTPSYVGHDHSFTLQAIMEMQKSIGSLQSSADNLTKSIQDLADKSEKTNEKLSGVTHKIYAAGVVLTIFVVASGFIINKAWDLMASQIAVTNQTQKK